MIFIPFYQYGCLRMNRDKYFKKLVLLEITNLIAFVRNSPRQSILEIYLINSEGF